MTFIFRKCIMVYMKKYAHIKSFEIKTREADFKDELKASSVLSFMEEVAGSSAEELGFGYKHVRPRGYTFMVTNVIFRINKQMKAGETVRVKTWPTKPSYVVFGREYEFLSEKEEVLLSASSRWCLIDVSTGKVVQSKVIDNQDYSTYNTDKALEVQAWKIPTFSIEEGEKRFRITIANSEYDHNLHVNNTRYADYCLNCYSISELQDKTLYEFAISYVRQCKEDETLNFYRKKCEDCDLVQGYNERGEIVVQARIVFRGNE